MNYYEAVFIVDPEWEGGDLQKMEEMVKEQVSKSGGDIHEVRNQGRQRLAYPIRKRNHGCYFLVRFQAEPAQIAALSAGLRLNPAVIRHLVVRLKGPFEPPAGDPEPERLESRSGEGDRTPVTAPSGEETGSERDSAPGNNA